MFLFVNSFPHFCGDNRYGQSGLGHRNRVLSFSAMKFPFLSPIYEFAQGWDHNLVILEDGPIYVWGNNNVCQLGLGDRNNRLLPTQLNFPFPFLIVRLFTKYFHTFALLDNGDVYGWGWNSYDQLGVGNMEDKLIPTQLNFQFPSKIRSIHCGYNFTLFLLNDNRIYGCGDNHYGQLGLGDTLQRLEPTRLEFQFPSLVQNIECGSCYTLVLLESNEIYGWGMNSFAQLGLGHNNNFSIPTKLDFSFPFTIRNIYCGYSNSYVLLKNGQLYGWGLNHYGQLGLKDNDGREIPTLIPTPFFVEEFRCHYHSCYALSIHNQTRKKELYGWGYNQDGNLGLGDMIDRLIPTLIPLSTSDIEFYSSQNQWKPDTHQFQSFKSRMMIETFLQLHHAAVPFLILEEVIQFLCQ